MAEMIDDEVMGEAEMVGEEAPMMETGETPEGEFENDESGIALFEFLNEGNLVEELKEPAEAASEIQRLYDLADNSMGPWRKKYKKALKLAKLDPHAQQKTFPFEKASNVVMPFILEAMLDFHSRTVPELVWRDRIVGMKTYGKTNEEKEDRAERVGDFMNYQVTDGMSYWRTEQDKLLLQLPCTGTGYKKTYFNGTEKEVNSDLFMADEVKFDHDCRTFEEAPDYFIEQEYNRNEVIEFIRGDQQWKIEEEDLPDKRDEPTLKFVRAFTWLDLDGDGLAEPYEVIYYTKTEAIVAVYPAYDEDGIKANDDGEIVKVERMPCFTQYRFLPDPDGGPMGMGWGILMADMFEAINTTVNQLIDAGTLANLAGNSGLIDSQLGSGNARGNRQQAGPIDVKMGQLTPVVSGGKPLAQSIVQFPYNGPNPTLFQLTQFMIEQMRSMTNAALNMDTNNQEAAIMYLTRLQQGLKVPNSIIMRVYDCAKHEFKVIAALNYKHHDSVKYNRILDGEKEFNMQADFNPDDCDIKLACDPSQGSDIERQTRADVLLQEAKEDQSGVLDKRFAYLNWLQELGVPDPELFAPEPSGEPDPMQQLMYANMQREARNEERRIKIDEVKTDLKRHEVAMEAAKNMAHLGLESDVKEADIAKRYAETFKLLWEIGMGDDPAVATEAIEQKFIDRKSPMIEVPKPVNFEPPQEAQQQPGAQAQPGGPQPPV